MYFFSRTFHIFAHQGKNIIINLDNLIQIVKQMVWGFLCLFRKSGIFTPHSRIHQNIKNIIGSLYLIKGPVKTSPFFHLIMLSISLIKPQAIPFLRFTHPSHLFLPEAKKYKILPLLSKITHMALVNILS